MKRRRLIAICAVLAMAPASVVGGHLYVRGQAKQAFADLSQCLVGEEGASSSNVVLRYRRHQLPLSSVDLEWDRRCDEYEKRLRETTNHRLYSWDSRGLTHEPEPLVLGPDEPAPPLPPWGAWYTTVWAFAEREGLTGGVSSVAGPPQHVSVPTLDDLRPSLLVEAHERPFRLDAQALFGAARPGFASLGHYCWANTDTLSCVKRPYESLRQRALGGIGNTTALGKGPLYTRENEIFLATTPDRSIATLTLSPSDTDPYSAPSTWAGEGDLAVVSHAGKGKSVVSIHSRGKLQRIDFDAELPKLFGRDAPLRSAELGPVRAAFGSLYFLGKRRGATQLYSVRVADDGLLTQPTELATVTTPESGWQVGIAVCNPAGDERIVVASLADETFVVFTAEGKPATTIHSGEMHRVYELYGCSRGRVALRGPNTMECTAEGCKQYEAFEMEPMRGPTMESRFVTATALLGDKTLYVWGAKHPWFGGLQMKLAPGAELAAAPTRLVLDDLVDGGEVGATGRVRDFELFGGTSEALLLLLLDDGRELAMRIDADGSVRPEQVRWTEPK